MVPVRNKSILTIECRKADCYENVALWKRIITKTYHYESVWIYRFVNIKKKLSLVFCPRSNNATLFCKGVRFHLNQVLSVSAYEPLYSYWISKPITTCFNSTPTRNSISVTQNLSCLFHFRHKAVSRGLFHLNSRLFAPCTGLLVGTQLEAAHIPGNRFWAVIPGLWFRWSWVI